MFLKGNIIRDYYCTLVFSLSCQRSIRSKSKYQRRFTRALDFHAKLRKLSSSKLTVIEIHSRRRHLASRNFSYQEP